MIYKYKLIYINSINILINIFVNILTTVIKLAIIAKNIFFIMDNFSSIYIKQKNCRSCSKIDY